MVARLDFVSQRKWWLGVTQRGRQCNAGGSKQMAIYLQYFFCIKYVNSVFDSGDKAAWGELKPEV